jgi:hypothetical protein
MRRCKRRCSIRPVKNGDPSVSALPKYARKGSWDQLYVRLLDLTPWYEPAYRQSISCDVDVFCKSRLWPAECFSAQFTLDLPRNTSFQTRVGFSPSFRAVM